MLPSALSVSPLLVGSVHYEIRLFGLLKALQSSDRSLLLDEGGLSSLAQSPLELRNDRVTYAYAALGAPCQDHRLLSSLVAA